MLTMPIHTVGIVFSTNFTESTMNLLTLLGIIVIVYWVVMITYVARKKDWT